MNNHRTPYTRWKLYFLCDPKQNDPGEAVRYVGITNNTKRRYREHCSGHHGTKAMRAWLRQLQKRGLRPVMKVYHFEGTLEAMRRQEASVIRQLRRQGADLLNCQHNTTPPYSRWPKPQKKKRRLSQGRKLAHPTLKKKLSGRVVPR